MATPSEPVSMGRKKVARSGEREVWTAMSKKAFVAGKEVLKRLFWEKGMKADALSSEYVGGWVHFLANATGGLERSARAATRYGVIFVAPVESRAKSCIRRGGIRCYMFCRGFLVFKCRAFAAVGLQVVGTRDWLERSRFTS